MSPSSRHFRRDRVIDRSRTLFNALPSPSWHWIIFLLAVLFNVLTISYASHPGIFSWHARVGGSPAKAVLLLSVLSGIANPMIAATLGHSLDILRDSLAARHQGHSLIDNQLLQAGTGVEALFTTIIMRHLPTKRTRLWSVFRLLCMIVVPALGIIIFSDINTAPVFYADLSANVAYGFEVGAFNTSLAVILQPITDLTFSTRFKDILSDSDLSIDISDDSDRAKCASATAVSPDNGCRSKYYLPGGIENYAPALLASDGAYNASTVQPILALNQNGFYFEFVDGNLQNSYNMTTDCVISGFPIGAFQLCMQNTLPNQLQVSITICPKVLGLKESCLNDSSWQSADHSDWAISLSMFQRHANIAYNGLNGTILFHEFLDSREAINISSLDLLGVFGTLLEPTKNNPNTAFLSYLTLLGLGANKPVLPLSIWQYFEGLKELQVNAPQTTRRAITGLQSLVTIPLYHCQAKDFAELRKLLIGLTTNNTNTAVQELGQSIVELFPDIDPTVQIYPASLRYNLQVGPHSLLAYMAISSFTLLLCLVAQLISFTGPGRKVRNMSSFPTRNILTDFEIQNEKGEQVPKETFKDMKGLCERDKVESMKKMKIVLVTRGATAGIGRPA